MIPMSTAANCRIARSCCEGCGLVWLDQRKFFRRQLSALNCSHGGTLRGAGQTVATGPRGAEQLVQQPQRRPDGALGRRRDVSVEP